MKPQAPKARAAGGVGAELAQDFEQLSEEEIHFCWLSLVENGQLPVEKLQEFMLTITGERLSTVQAKDLLKYMDANGDGNVGQGDFRNFVSIGRLEDTNPKDFMWTPKRKYREEHGTDKQPKDEGFLGQRREDPLGGCGAHPGFIEQFHEEPLRRAAPAGRSPRKPRSPPQSLVSKSLRQLPPTSLKLQTTVRSRIEASIEKYEQESFKKFLEIEEEFKEKLYKQFVADPEGMQVTEYHKMLLKWHKLARWAMPGDLRPGDSLAALKYVLERDGRFRKAAAATAAAGVEAGTMSTEVPQTSAAAVEEDLSLPPDARMSYRLWTELINGRHRPEEHHSRR